MRCHARRISTLCLGQGYKYLDAHRIGQRFVGDLCRGAVNQLQSTPQVAEADLLAGLGHKFRLNPRAGVFQRSNEIFSLIFASTRRSRGHCCGMTRRAHPAHAPHLTAGVQSFMLSPSSRYTPERKPFPRQPRLSMCRRRRWAYRP